MFELGKTVVSEELFESHFVCDLNACKGACCVDGSAGAPLEAAETRVLTALREAIFSFPEGRGAGSYCRTGRLCQRSRRGMGDPFGGGARNVAYVVFDDNGIAQCGIEKSVQCRSDPLAKADFLPSFTRYE